MQNKQRDHGITTPTVNTDKKKIDLKTRLDKTEEAQTSILEPEPRLSRNTFLGTREQTTKR